MRVNVDNAGKVRRGEEGGLMLLMLAQGPGPPVPPSSFPFHCWRAGLPSVFNLRLMSVMGHSWALSRLFSTTRFTVGGGFVRRGFPTY